MLKIAGIKKLQLLCCRTYWFTQWFTGKIIQKDTQTKEILKRQIDKELLSLAAFVNYLHIFLINTTRLQPLKNKNKLCQEEVEFRAL